MVFIHNIETFMNDEISSAKTNSVFGNDKGKMKQTDRQMDRQRQRDR